MIKWLNNKIKILQFNKLYKQGFFNSEEEIKDYIKFDKIDINLGVDEQ